MSTTKWNIDKTHSNIGFKVKHMMFTNVNGNFNEYDASIEFDNAHFENAKLDFTAHINSVNTNNKDRDIHLVGADFFDSEKYPELKFKSHTITKTGDLFKVTGDLELHGEKKSITLDVEKSEEMIDPWGNTRIALNIAGKINRKDWGLSYNAALETGGLLISEEVKLNIELQILKA